VVAHTCNFSYLEAEIEGSWLEGSLGKNISETISKKNQPGCGGSRP
jgi:hypothetical protein